MNAKELFKRGYIAQQHLKAYAIAKKYFEQAANLGHVEAMVELARMYERHYVWINGTEYDKSKAFYWYKEAAKHIDGDDSLYAREAMSRVGDFYREGEIIDQDFQKAKDCYCKALNFYADNSMQRLYWHKYIDEEEYKRFQKAYDEHIERDNKKSFEEFLKRAKSGDTWAMQVTASNYRMGCGTDKDESESEFWTKKKAETEIQNRIKAAQAGDSEAMLILSVDYDLGRGVEKDKNKSLEWLKKSAALGNELAIARIDGTEDELESYFNEKYDKEKAESGNVPFMRATINRLVDQYEKLSASEDKSQKLKSEINYWRQKMIESNDVYSIIMYSFAYANNKNYDKATEYAKKAVELGGPLIMKATLNYDSMPLSHCPPTLYSVADYDWYKDYWNNNKISAEAIEWYKALASGGDVAAMNALGKLYELGNGIEQDFEAAIKWYEKAAEISDHFAFEQIKGDSQYDPLGHVFFCDDNSIYEQEIKYKFNRKKIDIADVQIFYNEIDSELYKLAQRIENGDGLPKDISKATEIYIKAAEFQHSPSMDRLAEICNQNIDTDQKILKWHVTSEKSGRIRAMLNIATKFYEIDKHCALSWFLRAFFEGDPDAAIAAASMLFYGDGICKNFIYARELYDFAILKYIQMSDEGNQNAGENLSLILSERGQWYEKFL